MEEFIIMPDFAVTKMRETGKKKLIYDDNIARIEWDFVPVSQARDYDGTFAGCDDRPNEEVLQLMIWRKNDTPRYTNFWSFKL